jgi:hypothetical protein
VQENSAENVVVEAAAKMAITAAEVHAVKRTIKPSVPTTRKTFTIKEMT